MKNLLLTAVALALMVDKGHAEVHVDSLAKEDVQGVKLEMTQDQVSKFSTCGSINEVDGYNYLGQNEKISTQECTANGGTLILKYTKFLEIPRVYSVKFNFESKDSFDQVTSKFRDAYKLPGYRMEQIVEFGNVRLGLYPGSSPHSYTVSLYDGSLEQQDLDAKDAIGPSTPKF